MEELMGLETLVMPDDERKPCPDCGGQPAIRSAQYGNAYFACCEACWWEGGLRQIEATPSAALGHWHGKFLTT